MKKAKRLSATLASAALATVLIYAGPAVASDTGQSDNEKTLASEQAPQSEGLTEEVLPTVDNQDRGRNENALPDEPATSSNGEAPLGNIGTAATPGLKDECPNPIFMAYYRTWRDVKMPHNANSDLPDPNVIAMTDLPYGVDIVSLFHYVDPSKNIDQSEFWNTVRDVYVPALHERGSKVIRTIGIDEFFRPTYGLSSTSTDDDFDAAAQRILETFVTSDGIDGLDIDMEQYLNLDQQIILERMYKALSAYLGPLSGTGRLLIYDTNRYASNSYVERVAPYIDYLFYQSYGASTSRLNQAITGYSDYISSCQFIAGYTSPEELDGNRWEDTIGPIWESNAITMAKWQPDGGAKGGLFQYAIDRDGMTYDEPDYSSIRPTTFEYAKRVIATIKSQEFAETKASATNTIEALPALSQELKVKLTARVRDAETFEEVFAAQEEAEMENLALIAQIRKDAIQRVKDIPGLSSKDREAALTAIEQATTPDEIEAIVENARALAANTSHEENTSQDKPSLEDANKTQEATPKKSQLAATGGNLSLVLTGTAVLMLGMSMLAVTRRQAKR